MLCGDFNMIRYAHEKNNDNFHLAEAESFNEFIDDLCLIELPLIDRSFTWSNRRVIPTLERLDRVFINMNWDEILPNTVLSSLTRSTSDHVPLKIEVSMTIPHASIFRFENYWIHCPGFAQTVSAAWACRTGNSTAVLAANLKQTRSALKTWRKNFSHISQQERDCRITINLLDFVEEHRALSTAELNLRAVIVRLLQSTTKAKLAIWKQRSKVRAAIEGDENTRYFHAIATQRRRRNQIQVIEHDGMDFYGHEQKASILHTFYRGLMGCVRNSSWAFSLDDLYPEGPLQLQQLGAPFELAEIKLAIHRMHNNASPGPDGFGPSFFKATWSTTSPFIFDLFREFYSCNAGLERINRSYLVLLPKKNDARKACDFRPIALQNTTIKSMSKVLTNRLQPLIPQLVSDDQAGFVLGRCISESFAYAADLLHRCYRRHAPTLILKLDFHKAFDCVNWESLFRILRHRGFPNNWCSWVRSLLDSGKTAVLLNGAPGIGSPVVMGLGKATRCPPTSSSSLPTSFAASSTILPCPLPSCIPSSLTPPALSYNTQTTLSSSSTARLMLSFRQSMSWEFLKRPRACLLTIIKPLFCQWPSPTLFLKPLLLALAPLFHPFPKPILGFLSLLTRLVWLTACP